MGCQGTPQQWSQSVGLGRNYGGFSRADRMVTTFVGIFLGAMMAFQGTADYGIPEAVSNLTGLHEINALNAVLVISLLGGIWTFMTRASTSRKELLGGE